MSGLDDLIKGATGGKGKGGLGNVLGDLAGGGNQGGGLGDILGGILGAGSTGRAGGGSPGTAGMGGMLAALLPMLGSMLAGGGLQRILGNLQANGLSAQADSWVSTGANKEISGAELRGAMGDEEIGRIATALGVSQDEAAEAVAQVLPVVVDKVSPEGRLEPDGQLSSAFAALEGLGSS